MASHRETRPHESISTQDLLALGQRLASAARDNENLADQYWDVVVELHRRPETQVFVAASALCRNDAPGDRELGADVLAQLGRRRREPSPFRDRSVPIIEPLLDDKDAGVIASSIHALCHLDKQPDRDRLRLLAEHSASVVRYAVAQTLDGKTDAEVDLLIALSRDEDGDVRNWATFGLGTLCEKNSPQIRNALLHRTEDTHDEARGEALLGLATRGDLRVLKPLIAELESKVVGSLSVEAARELGHTDLLPALRELQTWWDVDQKLLSQAVAACTKSTSE